MIRYVQLFYDDFDYFPSDATIDGLPDGTGRIIGTGCLRVRRVSGVLSPALNYARVASRAQGLIVGSMRMACNHTLISSAQTYGLCCLQSQRNISVSGQAYLLSFAWGAGVVRLHKMTSGLTAGKTLLAQASVSVGGGLGSGDEYALQLSWQVSGGVVNLKAYYGRLYNFSDLTLQLTHTDSTSPYTTSVAEGAFFFDGGAGTAFDVYYDQHRFLPDFL